MVIRPENVDQAIEAAFPLVEVVGDIGGEIGLRAVLADDHAVLLVAEVGRTKPGGAVFLVKHAAFFEHGERIVDPVAFRQALLGEPAVEGDAELGQVVLDVVADAVERLLPHAIEAVFAEKLVRARNQCADVRFLVALRCVGRNAVEDGGGVRRFEAVRVDRGRDVANILTAVARIGKCELHAP